MTRANLLIRATDEEDGAGRDGKSCGLACPIAIGGLTSMTHSVRAILFMSLGTLLLVHRAPDSYAAGK